MTSSGSGPGKYFRMQREKRRLRSILLADRKIMNPALAVLGAVACAWLVMVWWPSSPPSVRVEGGAAEARSVYPARPIPPLSSYKIVVERDLFSPLRRNYAWSQRSVRMSTASVVRPPSGLDLVGTVLLGTRKVAIMRTSGSGSKPGEYEVGDAVAGYVVLDIQRDRVVLGRGGRSFEVIMGRYSASHPVPAGRPGQGGYRKNPPAAALTHDTAAHRGHTGRVP